MSNLVRVIVAVFAFACSGQVLAQELYVNGGIGNAEAEAGGFDGNDTYVRLGVGYGVTDVVAVEGGYWDLGEAEDGGFSVSADGLFGALKATAPGREVNFFGRIGLYMWDATVCASGFGCADDDGSDIFFGGGVGFAAGPGKLDVELHMMELDDVDVTTIGVSYSVDIGR